MRPCVVLFAAVAVAACSGASTRGLPLSRVVLAECDVPGVRAPALCGTYEVWENRAAGSGRRIPLHIVVVPARAGDASQRKADPLVYFDGGPGGSATGAAGWVSRLLRDVNGTRDLVFVDVRGTGRSAALECPAPSDDDALQAFFEPFLSEPYVRRCLDGQQADVRFYTQPIAMDDVDEVRTALGYGQINLFGTSGGTRQAQIYVRRHGASVRAAVLQGVVPMDGEMPLAFARAMEAGLRALFDRCARDARCRGSHPALEADWERVKSRLDGGAVTAAVRHPRTGRQEVVTITRGVFADGIRHMLYNLQGDARLAEVIESAARGDFGPFAQAELQQAIRFDAALSHGFFLSSTCSEDVAFIDEDEIRAATAGTFLGDYRVRQQQAACRLWPRGAGIDADFQRPVQSAVPVLALSGDADVATPASGAERAIADLPNARHVIFSDQGHALRDPACAARLIADFIESADAKRLDVSCAETSAAQLPPRPAPAAAGGAGMASFENRGSISSRIAR